MNERIMLIMNNIYNWKEIGKRIKKERKKMKLNQQELADKIFISSRQTISNWENGDTKPQLEDIISLCNLFQCEIGYLLAEPDYNCRTRGNSYIQDVTGLSEKAIEKLVKWHDEIGYNALIHGGETSVLDLSSNLENEDQAAIDFMLCNSKGRLLLSYIASYMYGDYVESEGNNNTSIMLHNKKMGYNRPFDTRLIKAGVLVNIQSILLECDTEISRKKFISN